MFERLARSARTAVENARDEAERRGDRRIGTDHLLVALLHDDELAQIVGVDAGAAQEAADGLDRSALHAIGLTLGDVRPRGSAALGRHVPLTSGAKTVLAGALAHTTAERARAITPRHLLLALCERHLPDPAVSLLDALAVDRAGVRERLATAG